ncbi:MAG TPA: DUF5131 family protein, partial [Phycisphaerae bacterium]|nr:DUF5131 family protein [Phycisphaerae bacterium]
ALHLMLLARRHTYVLLTQQPSPANATLVAWYRTECERAAQLGEGALAAVQSAIREGWFVGATCTDQEQFELAGRTLGRPDRPWRWWASVEPIAGLVRLPAIGVENLAGVIVGADNRPGPPFRMDWIRGLARECGCRNIPLYVKQVWMWRCPRCSQTIVEAPLFGHGSCPTCGTNHGQFQQLLCHQPDHFPEDLRIRRLPWTLTLARGAAIPMEEARHRGVTEGTDAPAPRALGPGGGP